MEVRAIEHSHLIQFGPFLAQFQNTLVSAGEMVSVTVAPFAVPGPWFVAPAGKGAPITARNGPTLVAPDGARFGPT